MILHNYLSNSGRDLIYEYINSLPEAEKIDGYTVLQHMEKGEFDKILFKRWEKKVYEVYFQKNNRVFYITVDKENIYLLHSAPSVPAGWRRLPSACAGSCPPCCRHSYRRAAGLC